MGGSYPIDGILSALWIRFTKTEVLFWRKFFHSTHRKWPFLTTFGAATQLLEISSTQRRYGFTVGITHMTWSIFPSFISWVTLTFSDVLPDLYVMKPIAYITFMSFLFDCIRLKISAWFITRNEVYKCVLTLCVLYSVTPMFQQINVSHKSN